MFPINTIFKKKKVTHTFYNWTDYILYEVTLAEHMYMHVYKEYIKIILFTFFYKKNYKSYHSKKNTFQYVYC